jgi:hypothetical protein
VTWQSGRAADGSFFAGAPVELPWAPNATDQTAQNVNDAGVIVGFVEIQGVNYGARWVPNGAGGYSVSVLSTDTWDSGIGINRCGRMSGTTIGPQASGFIWDGVAAPVLLPGLAGSTDARSYAINDRGDVVGASLFSVNGATVWRPTLWRGFVAPCP